MNIVRDDGLQALADKVSAEKLRKHADTSYVFDNEDPYQTGEIFEAGIHAGLKLESVRSKFKFVADDIQAFVVTDVEEDGSHYFVGTRQMVATLLESLAG